MLLSYDDQHLHLPAAQSLLGQVRIRESHFCVAQMERPGNRNEALRAKLSERVDFSQMFRSRIYPHICTYWTRNTQKSHTRAYRHHQRDFVHGCVHQRLHLPFYDISLYEIYDANHSFTQYFFSLHTKHACRTLPKRPQTTVVYVAFHLDSVLSTVCPTPLQYIRRLRSTQNSPAWSASRNARRISCQHFRRFQKSRPESTML